MPTLYLTTAIAAPPARVFDLARSIDLHSATTSKTSERAIAGVTSGLIGLGQSVTWKAKHFGIWQTLTVRMTHFDAPHCFEDVMTQGAFAHMKHRHLFLAAENGGTQMKDEFTWGSPLGILGWLADKLFLARYMRRFIQERNQELKRVAESNEWASFLRNEGL